MAPFGIEDKYLACGVSLTGLEGCLSVEPMLFMTSGIGIVRVPVTRKYSLSLHDAWTIDCFAGGGVEYYFSAAHQIWSPVLTGGIGFSMGPFFIKIPVSTAFRGYNTDSDIGFHTGWKFEL